MNALPAGFWACLVGTGLFGGLAIFLVWRFVRVAGAFARLRRVFADEGASSIVEFPFALITLTMIILLTCQLAFMATAYLVVDYAAYAAVRCAIVTIPEDRSDEDEDPEESEKVAGFDLEKGSKGADIRDAAIFVCAAVSGSQIDALAGEVESTLAKFGVILDLPGSESLPALGGLTGYVDRYLYSRYHTKVRLVVEDEENKEEFEDAELLTVEVTHQFSLVLPVADRTFGTKTSEGYQVEMKGKASMLNEGYPGEEKEPEEAEEP